jgi:hypothetical protein
VRFLIIFHIDQELSLQKVINYHVIYYQFYFIFNNSKLTVSDQNIANHNIYIHALYNILFLTLYIYMYIYIYIYIYFKTVSRQVLIYHRLKEIVEQYLFFSL